MTKDGPATIEGVATTHYSAIIDPSRVAKIEKTANLTIAYGPLEVWIDGQGLVRRMHMTAIQGGPTSAAQATFSMTMTLSDYGEVVTAAVPPDSEVYDATSLATTLLKK